jgi:hypothetical protein
MKRRLKWLFARIGRAMVGTLLDDLYADIQNDVVMMNKKLDANAQVLQLLLRNHWNRVAKSGGALPAFRDVGFRCYSQFEEDGILLYIFSLIGSTNRKCVELCAGHGLECCTANLIINHGWQGFLFDGSERNVQLGRSFFESCKDTFLFPPSFTQAWITAENVNELLVDSGVQGEVDLLSLDLDGVDYWIWRAIDIISPRVVVCETHNVIPADLALTVPYDPNFTAACDDYRGASLSAMAKLADEKGYRLVGTHRHGFNAFFVKRGCGDDLLPEVCVGDCLSDPYSNYRREAGWPSVCGREWVEV